MGEHRKRPGRVASAPCRLARNLARPPVQVAAHHAIDQHVEGTANSRAVKEDGDTIANNPIPAPCGQGYSGPRDHRPLGDIRRRPADGRGVACCLVFLEQGSWRLRRHWDRSHRSPRHAVCGPRPRHHFACPAPLLHTESGLLRRVRSDQGATLHATTHEDRSR